MEQTCSWISGKTKVDGGKGILLSGTYTRVEEAIGIDYDKFLEFWRAGNYEKNNNSLVIQIGIPVNFYDSISWETLYNADDYFHFGILQ